MRYQNGLNQVLLLRSNDLGFHAMTTSAVSRQSAQAQLTDDYSERRGTSGSLRTTGMITSAELALLTSAPADKLTKKPPLG